MENNFGIKLNASIDEIALKTSIDNFLKKNTFKIKVEVDSTSSTMGGTSSSGGTRGGGGASSSLTKAGNRSSASKATIDLLGNEDKLTVVLDENNRQIAARVDRIEDLNNKSTSYYSIAENGEVKLTKTVASKNLGLKETLKLQQQNEKNIYKLQKSIEAYGSQTKLSQKEVKRFNTELSNISNIEDEIEKSEALDKLNIDIKTAANSSGILGQSFAKAMVKYVTWLGIAKLVAGISNSLKDMISIVKDFDAAMTELNKVYDTTNKGLTSVRDKAFEVADAVGGTGLEVLNATTEFKRMGYTIDESLDLAEIAIMMTNVAEGITNAGDAANILTSILKGTNTDIKYAESLLDRLNEISNNNAISFDALANMTQEAAATMDILGNNLDQTMGLLTGAYEILQDESVARGVQTIGLRIAGLNEDMESVAGLSNEVVEALQKYAGISAFDEQTGQLKNTYTILEELAEVWDTIDKNKQSALLNKLAGKQQADVASAILSNWKGVESAVEDAQNSMGSAAKENARAMASIAGAQKELENAIQELAVALVDSGIIQFLTEIATGFIDIVTGFIKFIDKSPTVVKWIFAIVGAVGALALTTAMLVNSWKGPAGIAAAAGAVVLGLTSIAAISSLVKDAEADITNGAKDATKAHSDLAESFANARDNLSDYDTAVQNLNQNLKYLVSTNQGLLEQLKEQQEDLKQEQELQEKLLKVEKAREALAEAKTKRIRVYRSGQGFVYAEDAEEMQSAQESLQNAVDKLTEYKYDLALERTEDFLAQLSDILTNGDIISDWDELFTEFGDLLDTEFADYISKAKDFVDEFNKIANQEETQEQHRQAIIEYNKSIDDAIKKLTEEENYQAAQLLLQYEDEIGDGLISSILKESLTQAQETLTEYQKQIDELEALKREIPQNATGTRSFGGGVTWVGENGPELLNLPKGSEILSNDKSMKLHDMINNPLTLKQAKGVTTLQFNGPLNFPNVTSESDAEGFINEIISIGNNSIPKLT